MLQVGAFLSCLLYKNNKFLEMFSGRIYASDSKQTFCMRSIQSSMPSCNGVSSESDTEDIIYGTASVCTGIQTAFVSTIQNFSKSSKVNLLAEILKLICYF